MTYVLFQSCGKSKMYAAISREVVGKSARDNSEIKVLWVILSSLFFKEISKNGRRVHGRMFASAEGKQQK